MIQMPEFDADGTRQGLVGLLDELEKEFGEDDEATVMMADALPPEPQRLEFDDGPAWLRKLCDGAFTQGDVMELRGTPGTDPHKTAMMMAASTCSRD
jgi:hypothetical protein